MQIMRKITIKIDGNNYGGESLTETSNFLNQATGNGFHTRPQSQSKLIIGCEKPYKIPYAPMNLWSHLQRILINANIKFHKIEITMEEE